MLRSLILIPLFLVAAVSGCSGAQADPEVRASATGDPFMLTQGDAVTIAGHALQFVDVVEDSRCPEDVTCVWEGRAKVTLSASDPDGHATTQILTLPYSAMKADESAQWEVGGLMIEFLDLRARTGPDDPREARLRVTPAL